MRPTRFTAQTRYHRLTQARPTRPADRPRRSTRGFTLMELLIVIAVIALLLSILLPAYASVMAAWLQHACRNNLGQIGRSCTAYAEGKMNRGGAKFLPSLDVTSGNWYSWEAGKGNVNSLWLLVQEDYCAPDNFICPEARRALGHKPARYRPDQSSQAGAIPDDKGFQWNTVSYSYITQVGYNDGVNLVPGVCIQTAESTRLVLLGDRNPYSVSGTNGQAEGVTVTTNSKNHRGNGQNFALLNQQILWVEKLNDPGVTDANIKLDPRLNGTQPYWPNFPGRNWAAGLRKYDKDAKDNRNSDSLLLQ